MYWQQLALFVSRNIARFFSLFFRHRIQCIAHYQLHNSQALLNLRRGYFSWIDTTFLTWRQCFASSDCMSVHRDSQPIQIKLLNIKSWLRQLRWHWSTGNPLLIFLFFIQSSVVANWSPIWSPGYLLKQGKITNYFREIYQIWIWVMYPDDLEHKTDQSDWFWLTNS